MRAQQTVSPVRPAAISDQVQGANRMAATIIFIFLTAILGVAGQLLLKYGMSHMGALQLSLAALPSLIWRMASSPYVVLGLLIYGSGTFFWLLVLNRVPLSYSYPFTSLGIVLGLLSAWGIFHEDIPPLRWLGMLVVCLGVFLVARS